MIRAAAQLTLVALLATGTSAWGHDDIEPPTPPADVSAVEWGTAVRLAWSPSTDNVGVTGYEVLRDGVPVSRVSSGTTTFVDSGLAAVTRFEYRVVARDAQGNRSTASGSAAVTTGSSCVAALCKVTEVAADDDLPWGLAVLPGEILYSRRDALDIIRLDPATGRKSSAGPIPGAEGTGGEGGVMGIATATDFASDPWLYVMHTTATDNRVVRIRYTDGILTGTPQVLLTKIPRNKYHNGGRLRFGPDGKLYIATGDAQTPTAAQDRASLAGKVLRLNPDGTIPPDNPFGNPVWSYGHRNPQGLTFDTYGRLWEQEFGESKWDETNLIVRGGNYGWPHCEGTCDDPTSLPPKRTYPTGEASCSGITATGDALYTACLRGRRLYRLAITGEDLSQPEPYLHGTHGRLRTVEAADDGLWLTTSTKGDKDSVPHNSAEHILKITLQPPPPPPPQPPPHRHAHASSSSSL